MVVVRIGYFIFRHIGHAFNAQEVGLLATLADDEALAIVSRQGLGGRESFGPNAPDSLQALLQVLQETRARGFSVTEETYTAGLNAMAAAVRNTSSPVSRPVMRVSPTASAPMIRAR